MALNKLKLGTSLSTQIAEQNANIDEIDNFMSGGVWNPITLASGVVDNISNPAMYREDSKQIYLSGKITAIPAGTTTIGTFPITTHLTQSFGAFVSKNPPVTVQLTALNGNLNVYFLPDTFSFLSLDGIVISK